ncbi:hypothetical protein MMC08_006565 [Hypocenomyce scalaris]|nr:hypothetical protein [Hypocenomyce scalaris]
MPNKYSYALVLSQLESQGRLDPNHGSHSEHLDSWYDSSPDSPRSGSIDIGSSSDPSAAPPSLSRSHSSPDTESLHSVGSIDSREAASIVTQIYAPQHPTTPPATEQPALRSPPLRPFPNYTRRDSTPQYLARSPESSKPYSQIHSHSNPASSKAILPPTTATSERTSLSRSTSYSSKKTSAKSTYTNDSYLDNLSLPSTLTPFSQEFDFRVNPWDDLHYLPSTFRKQPPSTGSSSSINLSTAPSSISRASSPDSAVPPPIARRRRPDDLGSLAPTRANPNTCQITDPPPKPRRLPSRKPSSSKDEAFTTSLPYALAKPGCAPTTNSTTSSPALAPPRSSSRNWTAGSYNIESMSEKKPENGRKRGMNPHLRAEMQAATNARQLPDGVGNTFIG